MRVYIADDLPEIRHAAQRILLDAGHEVRTFESADAALDAIRVGAPDLLLSDVCMPGELDGVEMAERLAIELPLLPVIIMSSERAMLDRARTIPTVRRLILKPVTRAEVLAGVAAAARGEFGQEPKPTSGNAADDIARVLELATEIAARTSHPHVGPEHLALVALVGPDGFGAMGASTGLDPSAVAEVLEECCPDGDGDGAVPATEAMVRVLARAAQLARLEESPRIRSGHIVLALLDEHGAASWRGLARLGMSRERVAADLHRRGRLIVRPPRWDDLPAVAPPRRFH